MEYKIKEVAELVGVTVRTLHYYDEIGLLKVSKLTEAGYRIYTESDLDTLQQILFFRELDFSLQQIKSIMNNPNFDKKHALEGQKDILTKKKKRLEKIINSIDKTIGNMKKGENKDMADMFKAFDMSEVYNQQKKYEKEVKEKYGNTSAYVESQKKTKKYNKEDWSRISEESNIIFENIAKLMDRKVDDPEVQREIENWRNHITNNFYNCTKEIFVGLGQMYIYDERFTKNIDKVKPGLAKFLSEAIEFYCK